MRFSSKSPFPGTFSEDAYMRDLHAQEKSGMVVLTDEHRKKNCIMLQSVKDLLPLNDIYKVNDCDMVYRFLIGRHWNVDEAVSSFRLYAEMREKEKINQVLGECFSDKLLSIVATAYGTDLTGRPILWCSPDKSTVVSVMKEYSKEDIIRVHLRQMEQARFCALSQGKDRCTYVLDMKNLPVRSFLSPTYIDFVKEIMKLLQNYYPEVMMKLIICNVNFAVNLGWSVVKLVVDSRIHEKLVFMSKPPGVAVLAPHIEEKCVYPTYIVEETGITKKKNSERGTSSPKERDTRTTSNEKMVNGKSVSRSESRERVLNTEDTASNDANKMGENGGEVEHPFQAEVKDEITELLRIEAARITDCIQRGISFSPPPCVRSGREVVELESMKALLTGSFVTDQAESTKINSPATSPPPLRSCTSAPSLHVSLSRSSSFDGDIFSVSSEDSGGLPSEPSEEERVVHEKERFSAKWGTPRDNGSLILDGQAPECSSDDRKGKFGDTELPQDSLASSLCAFDPHLSVGKQDVIEYDSKNSALNWRKEEAQKKKKKGGILFGFFSRDGEERHLHRPASRSAPHSHDRSPSPRTLYTTSSSTDVSSPSVLPNGAPLPMTGVLPPEESANVHYHKTLPSLVEDSRGNENQERRAVERGVLVEGIATGADHRRHGSAFERCTKLDLTYTTKDTVLCSYRGSCCARMEKSRVFATFPMEGIDYDDQDGMNGFRAFPLKPSASTPSLEERRGENVWDDEDGLRTAFSTQGSFTSGDDGKHSSRVTVMERESTRVHRRGVRRRRLGRPSSSCHQHHNQQQLEYPPADPQRQPEVRQAEEMQRLTGKQRFPMLLSNSLPSSSWVLCGELLHASGHYFHTTLLVCDGERRVNFILKCSNFHRRILVYMVVGSNREVETTAGHTHFFPLNEKSTSSTGEPSSKLSSTNSSYATSRSSDTVGETRRQFVHIGTVASHRYTSSTVNCGKNGGEYKSSVSTVSCATPQYGDGMHAVTNSSKAGREAWMMLGTKVLVSRDRSALNHRGKSYPLPRRTSLREMSRVGGAFSPTGSPSALLGRGTLSGFHRSASVDSLHHPSSYTCGFSHLAAGGVVGGSNSVNDIDSSHRNRATKNASAFVAPSPTLQVSGVGSRAFGDPSHFQAGRLSSVWNAETEERTGETHVRQNNFILKRASSFSSLRQRVKHSVAKVLPFSRHSPSVMVGEHRDQVLSFYGDLAFWYQPHDLFALGAGITSLWTG